jgi:hypothetical protein
MNRNEQEFLTTLLTLSFEQKIPNVQTSCASRPHTSLSKMLEWIPRMAEGTSTPGMSSGRGRANCKGSL